MTLIKIVELGLPGIIVGAIVGASLGWYWMRRKEKQRERHHAEYMAEVKKLTKLWDNCERTDCANHQRVLDSVIG